MGVSKLIELLLMEEFTSATFGPMMGALLIALLIIWVVFLIVKDW